MSNHDPEVRGQSVTKLRKILADPDTSRSVRIKAEAALRNLTGAGNRGVGAP
jgi:hypothetical protein